MSTPREGKLLYHLTHLDNMASILKIGLMPRNQLNGGFTDTADPGIISGRHDYSVDLSNYVPFHFFVKNPYDGAVCKAYGSENMVIIAIPRPRKNFDAGYYIIPNHPLSGAPDFLSYQDGFNAIRWDLLDNNNSNRQYSNPAVKQACLAECDVDHIIYPNEFSFVYVATEVAKRELLSFPNSEIIGNKVQVAPYMFP